MSAIECPKCMEIINWTDRFKHRCDVDDSDWKELRRQIIRNFAEDIILEEARERDYERKEARANMQLDEGVKTDE